MVQEETEIISNKNIKQNYFELVLCASQIAKIALPGQFVNIKVSEGIEPLLRRPLSIHKISRRSQATSHKSTAKENIVMLYEVVGKGTEMLAQRKAGEHLDVIGPLGNSFRYPLARRPCLGFQQPKPLSAKRYPFILIAGGMGTAPLVFLAQQLAYSVERIADSKNKGFKLSAIRYPLNAKVLIGAKTRDSILCEKEFKELGCDVKIATDDGSRGFKGYVSDLLSHTLSTIDYRLSTIYACGPKLLLKEISRISLEYDIPAQLSLESHMACGIGACMGCVIKVTSHQSPVTSNFEYKRVCKEGPVFEARQIVW